MDGGLELPDCPGKFAWSLLGGETLGIGLLKRQSGQAVLRLAKPGQTGPEGG